MEVFDPKYDITTHVLTTSFRCDQEADPDKQATQNELLAASYEALLGKTNTEAMQDIVSIMHALGFKLPKPKEVPAA